jgi:hypothetical protein
VWLALVASVPILAQGIAHARFREHLGRTPAVLLDQASQRDLAEYLVRNHIGQPITTAPSMVGPLEVLSRGRVQPLHGFALLEGSRTDSYTLEDLRRGFRRILEVASREPRFVILAGKSGADSGPWADDVRKAFLAQAAVEPGGWERVAAFGNAGGQPLFEVYRIGARPPGMHVVDPPLPDDAAPNSVAREAQRERPASPDTLAALGRLAPGEKLGVYVIQSISEPFRGAILIRVHNRESSVVFELRRYAGGAAPPAAFSGDLAIYYRRPHRGYSAEEITAVANALAARLEGSDAASSPPASLQPLPSRGTSL